MAEVLLGAMAHADANTPAPSPPSSPIVPDGGSPQHELSNQSS